MYLSTSFTANAHVAVTPFALCFHGNALFQRERMALNHIIWLRSNSNLYFE